MSHVVNRRLSRLLGNGSTIVNIHANTDANANADADANADANDVLTDLNQQRKSRVAHRFLKCLVVLHLVHEVFRDPRLVLLKLCCPGSR